MNQDTSVERFWANVEKTDGCWLWTGYKRKGYGTLKVNRKQITAHRFSFFLHHGKYPNVCMHTCDNPACVNPEHLIDGTFSLNRQDCVRKNRHGKGSRFKGKTHCQSGHEYTEENTYKWLMPNGRYARLCRTCNRARMRAFRAKRLALRLAKNETPPCLHN